MCKYCQEAPVIKLSNKKLCKLHFIRYFDKKVLKTIRVYKLISKKDKVGIAISGGKDSLTCLYLLNNILKTRIQKLISILIDEGIKGYRE